MITSNSIVPGMMISLEGKVYRVESSVKISVAKGTPFIKTKLQDLISNKAVERNFKLNQSIEEVSLEEHRMEYLYPESKGYLFLDIDTLDHVLISSKVLSDKINYLKEGVQIKALFNNKEVFSVDLPQFLELMVVKVEEANKNKNTKKSQLETGATIEVPLFVEVGDVIKVDVSRNEYIQRV